jgi:hypothetical protein
VVVIEKGGGCWKKSHLHEWLIDPIDQAAWFYGKPVSHLLLVPPPTFLFVLVPF